MNAITLTGNNSYLIDQIIRDKEADYIKSHGQISIERLNAEELEANEIVSKLSAVSLFAAKKLVILKGLSQNLLLIEQLDRLLDQPADDTELLIIEPHVDRRSKLFNKLKTKTVLSDLGKLSTDALIKWIISLVEGFSGSISRSDANYLIERVGDDQQLLYQELSKLILYTPSITHQTIDLLVEASPQSQIFDLMEATFTRKHSQIIKLYEEQRALKVEPVKIIGLLAWQLHILAAIKAAANLPVSSIASNLGTYPSVISKSTSLANQISSKELHEAVNKLLAMDDKSKQQSINIDDALLYYLLSY